MAWSNAEVRDLVASQFVAAADEVDKLLHGTGEASRLYREIATRHIDRLPTTQGTYLVTPSGIKLDSSHTLEPQEMLEFLTQARKKYRKLPRRERLRKSLRDIRSTAQSQYPENGLVLDVVLRKLYTNPPGNRRGPRGYVLWNRDFAQEGR